ncbi:hypothetical protein QQS21_008725 [Conoideocrella luteorostrata]|uniref:Uncharacterized protein n=1 Tax=Conoideocrella luteorostrata TaxID=1105319 RepID=A0AAJ0FYE9_9HYPO|nr:hypothetical protein QQS21_008725 [Conoideocrella luteorostrata]
MPALQWPGSFVRSHNIFVGGKLQRRRSLVHHPPCIFNAPATKRKRRRNETRILELEKKLEEVRQSVSMSHSIGQQASTASGVSTSTTPTSFDEIIGLLPPGAAPTWLRAPVSREEVEQVSFPQDPVTRGLVQLSTASELCVKFCEELLPRYPLVLPPSPLSLPVLRQHHPALFRAILATASSSYSPDHWRLLFGDAERYVVEQATITGKKSLDLAQAAIVLATWSYPPDRFEDLNFSQFANIAANIVIDLRSSGDERYHIPAEHNCTQTEVDLEAARTFLASYFLCSR